MVSHLTQRGQCLITALWIATLWYSVFQGLMYGTRSAIFMDVTNPAVAATQFTAYMAMMNLAIAIAATWQGVAAQAWGYPITLLVDAITGYVLSQDENPLKGQPARLPLKLVGDGVTPRYQDNEGGQVTLHSRESLESAGVALGDVALDEARFRHNIVIEGVTAWEEQAGAGRALRVACSARAPA